MIDSTTNHSNRTRIKPQKPRPDFPLYSHCCGKWAKTIRGRTVFFGRWEDPESALTEYLNQKDDLYAGRTPGMKGGLTIRDLCNAFISSKKIDLHAGRLAPRSFCEYDRECRTLIDEFGATRSVLELKPVDFEKLYAKLSRECGIATLSLRVTVFRMIFKYGFESDLIERPVKFGPKFKTPSKTERRKAAARTEYSNGKKIFKADEIRRMIDDANPQLKAMILLGINGGMGNSDCSSLPLSALDLDAGWLDYARVKTGVNRRIPLWSETVQALREVIANRRKPADAADADLIFITRFGLRWVRGGFEEKKRLGKTIIKARDDNQLGKTFSQLLEKLGLKRPGIGFYALRHTFETVAGGSLDQVSVNFVMGHIDSSMAATYRHGIEESRLKAVVDHVRNWLYPKNQEANKKI